MSEQVTSVQPPGLMKVRLMHHQEHHQGHQAHRTVLDVVCHPHSVMLPHERLHGDGTAFATHGMRRRCSGWRPAC